MNILMMFAPVHLCSFYEVDNILYEESALLCSNNMDIILCEVLCCVAAGDFQAYSKLLFIA